MPLLSTQVSWEKDATRQWGLRETVNNLETLATQVVLPWYCPGTTLVLPWDYYPSTTPLLLPWDYPSTNLVLLPCEQPRDACDPAVVDAYSAGRFDGAAHPA